MKLPHIKKSVIIKNLIMCILLVAIGWYLKARFTPEMPAGGGAIPEPFVITQAIESKNVSPFTRYIGRVEAVNRVEIKPKVTGAIIKVLFDGGEVVKKDDVLFVIEQDKYIATVKLREADLAKAKAVLRQAEKDYNRQKSLNQQKFVSEAALENVESLFFQAKASVKQAEANLDTAKLDLEYTEIKAPISGKIGKPIITEGNIVGTTTEALATIVQMDPVRVTFSMSDKDFLKYKKAENSKQDLYNTELVLSDGTVIKEDLISKFANNEITASTATIAIYTEHANKEELLVPGNYVRVVIRDKQENNSLLIPQVAIAQDEIGSYTFVVNKDSVVEQRRLVLGEVIGEQQVVSSGVAFGENVIIQGLQKVADGTKVKATLVSAEQEN